MSERLKRFFSHGGTIAFITGFFLYIAVVLPILINDKGIFTIVGDYSSQSIPFAYHIRDCLLSGNVCWDWSSGLGSQFLGDYAYYNLFSPFSLIYLIVQRDAIIYAMPFVTAVKYGTGSCLAYFYASRFLKNKQRKSRQKIGKIRLAQRTPTLKQMKARFCPAGAGTHPRLHRRIPAKRLWKSGKKRKGLFGAICYFTAY